MVERRERRRRRRWRAAGPPRGSEPSGKVGAVESGGGVLVWGGGEGEGEEEELR